MPYKRKKYNLLKVPIECNETKDSIYNSKIIFLLVFL